MVEQLDVFLYKFRFALMGVLVMSSLTIVVLLLTATQAASCPLSQTTGSFTTGGGSDDPNAVSAGLLSASDSLGQTLDTVGHRASCNLGAVGKTFAGGTHTIATTTAHGMGSIGSAIGHGTMATVRGIGYGLRATGLFLIGSASNTARFIAETMGRMNSLITRTPLVGAVIRPSTHTALPVIDDGMPLPMYAATALPPVKIVSQTTPLASPSPSPVGIWPIHGAITTEFGVPEPPYQPIHTGIDISDGARSGVTPVHPFRPGRVIEVIHSARGLGNHIVIDHGDSISSVYGHLYSTALEIGQQVDQNTILGYEGSTGASTGPHVHFEIRVGGQPVNPHRYIAAQP